MASGSCRHLWRSVRRFPSLHSQLSRNECQQAWTVDSQKAVGLSHHIDEQRSTRDGHEGPLRAMLCSGVMVSDTTAKRNRNARLLGIGSAVAATSVCRQRFYASLSDAGTAERKVAPLPEDIVPEAGVENDGEEEGGDPTGVRMPRLVGSVSTKQKKVEVVSLSEAIKRVKSSAKAEFDETVEAHVRLSIDPRRGDQIVRGGAALPHGVGKVVRIAVFAEGEKAEEARSAGADVVGANDLIELVKESGGKLPFDRCIATPSIMPRLGQIGRILGPRGLMPNPKVGTVTNDVGGAVRAAKFGRVEFRADKGAIVHAGLGKISFPEEGLMENVGAFSAALLAAKPVGLKGSSKYHGYFTSFSLSSTMGPGVKVDVMSVAMAADAFVRRRDQALGK